MAELIKSYNLVPVAVSESGEFQLMRYSETEWRVYCYLTDPGNKGRYSMGSYDEATARAMLSYASVYGARARHAVRKLYKEADYEPLDEFVASALANPVKRLVEATATITLDIRMLGDPEDIQHYLEQNLRHLVRARNVEVKVSAK